MANNHPHDTESSDSDDHFSDAHSGLDNSGTASPVPVTRVEKVDSKPSHGEVPGTDAYNLRMSDAQPDEIAVIPVSEDSAVGTGSRTRTPGGHPIPTTVVEKIDNSPSHGEIPGTVAHRQRAEDAMPDVVIEAGSGGDSGNKIGDSERTEAESGLEEEAKDAPGSPTLRRTKPVIVSRPRRTSSGASRRGMKDGEEDDGGFGDDFDDFEEGEEDAEFDDDDFDDGFQEAAPPPAQPTPAVFSFPVLNFSSLDSPSAITDATEPYLDILFPPSSLPSTSSSSALTPPAPTITTSSTAPPFLTPRSASLWSQLVAPPPLQPPNWIRSRIRRLFLISLGVPIDLDEILPASSQKKLILPSSSSLLSSSTTSPRTSSTLSRLKSRSANPSTTSLDSQGKARGKRKPPSAPPLDLLTARQLCSTTREARDGLTIAELKEHVERLEGLQLAAKEALEYWTRKTDETIGDREAFEGVIENLVKHARKVRK